MPTLNREHIEGMFKFCGIDYDKLVESMKRLAKLGLLEDGWTNENPFKNNSYVVAECVYHYLAPARSEPYKVQIGEVKNPLDWNRDKYHYFVRWPNGLIVDLAARHFDNLEDLPDYTKSKPFRFHKPTPTVKAKKLAEFMGLLDD